MQLPSQQQGHRTPTAQSHPNPSTASTQRRRKRQRNQSGGVTKHGNYRRYYARRLSDNAAEDDRLQLLQSQWLHNSTPARILDIGCNDGTFTLQVARRFPNARVLGVELDRALIGRARKAVRTEAIEKKASTPIANPIIVKLKEDGAVNTQQPGQTVADSSLSKSESFVPLSCHVVQGPVAETKADVGETETEQEKSKIDTDKQLTDRGNDVSQSASEAPPVQFPFNVTFRAEDFVAETPGRTALETGSFDVVLCLSVTKWVHLKGGDEALKRLFGRLRDCLRPGGVLVLEPQLKRSYKLARVNGYVENAPTFAELKLKPTMFKDYLLSKEGGFGSMEMLRDVRARGQAFNRPVMAFFKKKHTIEEESKCQV